MLIIPHNLITSASRGAYSGYERDDFQYTKIRAITAAKDLHYDEDVIKELRAAKSEGEIERIMRTARHKKFNY